MKNPYLKRLRIQFILVMMGICLGFLLTIFGVQYFSSRRSMRQESETALDIALDRNDWMMGGMSPGEGILPEGKMPEDDLPPKGGKRGWEKTGNDRLDRTAILVVQVDSDGAVSTERNELFYLEDTDVQTLTEDALATGKSAGTLKSQKMRFKLREEEGVKRIAFVDISAELSKLKKDLRNALLIGSGVMLVMFLLSLFLSKITLRPVAKAWDDQKRFIADASHELKTPLTVILSNAEMMRKSNDQQTPKNARRLDNLETEAVRMKELVQELLEIARGDIGEKSPEKAVLDLSELVSECSLTWEPVFFEAGKTLETDIEEELTLSGNADSLRRLVTILLDNALKYSHEKGTISLQLKKENGFALISVENEGDPMTPDVLGQIFDRFYRADSSREETPGYGLGLPIAESIVKQHGGTIHAAATEKTNVFLIKLPLS